MTHDVRNRRLRIGALRPRLTLLLTVVCAASLALLVYLATTSIPFLATSPATDPLFGAQNACLIGSLDEARVGFAVSPDGQTVAAYGTTQVAVCRPALSGALKFSLSGVVQASFDFQGGLWLIARAGPEAGPRLYLLGKEDRAPKLLGDFAPIAIAGHRTGAVALDGSGRVISLDVLGNAGAFAELPQAPWRGARLSTNASGEMVALVSGGWVFVYRAKDLGLLRREAPCEAEYLWWLEAPALALVECGPNQSWAMVLDAVSGTSNEAPPKERIASVLVPILNAYAQSCEGLPCVAPAP